MTAWECLGLDEGANRSQIRHAYHRKAVEWHPDKWSGVSTRSLQSRAAQVYAHITVAYNQLLHDSVTTVTK